MSLPRNNYLRNLPTAGYVLVSEPYNIWSIFESELEFRDDIANSSLLVDYSDVSSGAVYFEVNVTGITQETLVGSVNFTFSSSMVCILALELHLG